MEKEEQIKRLAQNLFNSGFTKSMDHAIQTAANMLGFSDELIAKKSSNSPQNLRSEENVTERMSGYTKDMARRITQSIAEERVYSQIPSSIRPNVVNNEKNHFEDTIFVNNTLQDETKFVDENIFEEASLQDNTLNQRVNNQASNEAHNPELESYYSSHPSILDNNNSIQNTPESSSENPLSFNDNEISDFDENFIENKTEDVEAEIPEWNDEEQTSLISGYVGSAESYDNNSRINDNTQEFESYSQDNTFEESQESEKIFKGIVHKEMDMESNESVKEIESKFDSILGPEEDFFSSTNDGSSSTFEKAFSGVEESTQIVEQPVAQAVQKNTSNMAEASVDITEMFNFRNLKN